MISGKLNKNKICIGFDSTVLSHQGMASECRQREAEESHDRISHLRSFLKLEAVGKHL